jgi:hypothetical protein
MVGTAGMGVLTPTRRRPTREEVAAINAALAKLPEAKVDAARAQAAPPATAAAVVAPTPQP